MQESHLLSSLCADRYTLETLRLLLNGSYIRVVNYHNTREKHTYRFEQEIANFSRHFVSVTPEDLDYFFDTREWPHDKPGLIPAVYEGWRMAYDVYAKVLDKYGFRGWFYVPSSLPDIPAEEQMAYCKPHSLRMYALEDHPDQRIVMNWDEIRSLSEKHEICCHTASHCKVTELMTEDEIRHEIVESKRYLENQIQKEVHTFCWCGGDDYQGSQFFHKYLEEAGYRFLVSNLKLERIRRKDK